MKDRQTIMILVLGTTAAILATMLVVAMNSQPAYAGASVRSGDYIMVNASFSKLKDVVYVIDVSNRRMNVYVVNMSKKAVDLIDQVELDRVFATQ